jgi:hypothetical protein
MTVIGEKEDICYAAYRHSKRQKGKAVTSDANTEDQNNPTYEESNDSSSKTDSDDGNDGDDTGGATASHATQEITHEQPLSPFTANQFTHCTQDQDHDGPTSSRIPSHTTNAPIDSSGSSSQWIDDVPITSPYKYYVPDIQSQ